MGTSMFLRSTCTPLNKVMGRHGKERMHILVCEVDLYPIKHVQGNGEAMARHGMAWQGEEYTCLRGRLVPH